MPVSVGTKFGPYEILAPLGKGGMGEVYRARDTKLDREVAIKVLPPALAQDPERLARFEREAKVLASLNHPNIAQIYAIEEVGGIRALVMELIPGQTVKGPISLHDVLRVATQVADALAAAHEKGITHRDLKPLNVMITHELGAAGFPDSRQVRMAIGRTWRWRGEIGLTIRPLRNSARWDFHPLAMGGRTDQHCNSYRRCDQFFRHPW
jgi:serine/threonine protein kinase